MAAPASTEEFLDLVRKSGVTDERRFTDYVTKNRSANALAPDASRMAGLLVRDGLLTHFQAEQILQGKWRRFTIGKYKVLERLGAGGMGSVYLCEHKLMRRRVAVKVLPTAKASDPSALERFYREARAVAALDHPNIVHAYDIDQDEQLHFLVMEYVDGASLQDIVKNAGPLEILRACHYIHQSAIGLEHAHLAGLVHRDIKPGNILVDRTGVVKILDMGLARFFNDEDDVLTKKFDENVLGTADYLAPEQAIDSHSVDIRADIYSLGATFYFMLTGRTPFGEGTVAQKLLWHQTRQPKPVSEYRKDTPPDLVAVILKMMDKDPNNRYQTPAELAEALVPFCETPIGPPPDAEMPTLSPAALGIQPPEQVPDTSVTLKSESSPVPKALQGMGSSATSHRPGQGDTAANAEANHNTPVSPTPKSRPQKGPSPEPSPVVFRPSSAPAAGTPSVAPKSPRPTPNQATQAAPNLPTPRTPKSQPKHEHKPDPKPEPVWEPFTTESADDGANFETDDANEFKVTSRPTSSKKSMKAGAPHASGGGNKKMLLIGGGVVAVLLIGGLVVGMMFMSPPAPVVPTRKPLEVTSDATKAGTFRFVIEAMRKAKKGDVIQLLDDTHEEALMLDFQGVLRVSSEVTIQPAPGKQVTWISSAKLSPEKPVITLRQAANLKIQGPGLTIDGALDEKSRVKYLVEINMKSPGVTFQNVHFKTFEESAVKLMNAAGDHGRPIHFTNCDVSDGGKEGVYLDANPSITPDKIDFVDFDNFRQAGIKTPFFAARPNILGTNVKGVDGLVTGEPQKK